MRLKYFQRVFGLTQFFFGGAAIIGITVTDLPVAQAGWGCTSAGFGIPEVGISSAYMCLDVPTDGLIVKSVRAYFVGLGSLCNYQVKLRWYDKGGKIYRTSIGDYRSGCGNKDYFWNYGPSGVKRNEGKVCAEMYESGILRSGSPCVAISP